MKALIAKVVKLWAGLQAELQSHGPQPQLVPIRIPARNRTGRNR